MMSNVNGASLSLRLVGGLSSGPGLLLFRPVVTASTFEVSSFSRLLADSANRPEPGTNNQMTRISAISPAAPRPIFSPWSKKNRW